MCKKKRQRKLKRIGLRRFQLKGPKFEPSKKARVLYNAYYARKHVIRERIWHAIALKLDSEICL